MPGAGGLGDTFFGQDDGGAFADDAQFFLQSLSVLVRALLVRPLAPCLHVQADLLRFDASDGRGGATMRGEPGFDDAAELARGVAVRFGGGPALHLPPTTAPWPQLQADVGGHHEAALALAEFYQLLGVQMDLLARPKPAEAAPDASAPRVTLAPLQANFDGRAAALRARVAATDAFFA